MKIVPHPELVEGRRLVMQLEERIPAFAGMTPNADLWFNLC
jgi:hypothetical protein